MDGSVIQKPFDFLFVSQVFFKGVKTVFVETSFLSIDHLFDKVLGAPMLFESQKSFNPTLAVLFGNHGLSNAPGTSTH
jgi:hypothetical protein